MSPDIKATADEQIDEIKGTLSFQHVEDKLMHSILDADKEEVENAKLLEQSLQASGSFHPELMMQQMVKDYALTKQLYGETLIRLLSSYNPNYVEKNIHIPEFQRDLLKKMQDKTESLKQKGLLTSEGSVSKKGRELVTLLFCVEELDNLHPKGYEGERMHKKKHHYGDVQDTRKYRKGDRYADIDMKKSVHHAIRRGRKEIRKEDLQTKERAQKGAVYVVYGLDASGSMKGKKLAAAKKAGIALSYRAIREKDNVGLVVFETEVQSSVEPTQDFPLLAETITDIHATKQTDMASTIRESIRLFPDTDVTKHLLLLTDALPTVGDEPEKDTLEAVAEAVAAGVTVSLVGLGLDTKGASLGKKMTALGKGKFYQVKNLDLVDKIVLEDYYDVY